MVNSITLFIRFIIIKLKFVLDHPLRSSEMQDFERVVLSHFQAQGVDVIDPLTLCTPVE